MGDLRGRVLGDYVLRERLGDGGYGEVYRAEHLELRCAVVVKVLNEERRWKDETAPARFRREAQLASQLRHPNAAQVYGFGVAPPEGEDDDEVMWIAMELVEGVNFADWLDAHGPMSLPEAVEFFEPLIKALDAAHQRGIVHRDVKPSNVMVIESKDLDSNAPVPKLIDFGVAKGAVEDIAEDVSVEVPPGDKVETELVRAKRSPLYWRTSTADSLPPRVPEHRRKITGSGVGIGSRAYMAPEQWGDAAKVTAAADIYSLGVMLCEAIMGRLPIEPLEKNTNGYLWAHLHGWPDLIQMPEAVRRVLDRALSKDPAKRQSNALELLAELRAALRSDPNAQIRSLSQRWDERGRSPDLLATGETLLELKRSVGRVRVASKLSKLDDAFITMSIQRAKRAKWIIGAIVALVGLVVLAASAEVRRRMADQAATELKVEQGRQALLHGESSEAARYLGQAFERGARSSDVTFMLARALQPRMSERARFVGSGRMWSAVFAPDGKRVLTSDDQGARMWDAASSQLLFTMGHGGPIYGAVFSPDGSRVITTGMDGAVRIWSAATGALVRELICQRSCSKRWSYYAVAMASKFVAAIDMTGKTVHVWDADTGNQLAELSNDGPGVALLAFSADGRWMATSGHDEVRVFDTSTWRQEVTISGPRIRSLAFDPSSSRIAVGTYDGMAAMWEIPTGARMRSLRDAGGASIDAIAFSRDGVLVATGSRDGTVQVWSSASGGLRTQFKAHRDKIYAVEFSLPGDIVLSAGADGAVAIANVTTGMPVARLEGSTSVVAAAHFDPGSHRIVGASWDGTSRVWDVASPYRRWGSSPVDVECDTEESLVPDRRFIAIGCGNHGTRVWDTARGELVAELPATGRDNASALPAVTATGDRAAIARGNLVEVYALPSGQLLRTIIHPAAVSAAAFASTGHDLVSGALDGSVRLTRDDGDPVALPMSAAGVDAAAVLNDGRVIVANASNRLRVIGADHSAVLLDVPAPSRIRLLRPSPDRRRLVAIAIASEQTPPTLWDLDRYRLVGRLEGSVGRVFTARFVADGGREILTVGSDGTPRLWDTATGDLRQSFSGDGHVLVDAALAPDGSMVVAGGSDGFLRFWSTSSGRLLWMLQAHRSYVVGVHYEGNDLVTRGLAGDVASWMLRAPETIIDSCRGGACGEVDAGK